MRPNASPFYRTLAFRVLLPIVVFGLAFGGLLIGSVRSVVLEFVDQQATNDLRWGANSIFQIIDTNLDELQRAGKSSDPLALRHRKVTALTQIEDFARANQLAVVVHDVAARRSFDLGGELANPAGQERWFMPTQRRYTHVINFEPWRWEITVVQDNRVYVALLNRLMIGAGLATVFLVVALSVCIFYLTVRAGRPIRKIIGDLEKNRPPQYKGIAEFEYLSRSIANMMDAVQEQSQLLEMTFANIGEGLCVFDSRMRGLACNTKFFEIYALPVSMLPGDLRVSAVLKQALGVPRYLSREPSSEPICFEHARPDGRTIEVRVHAMGDARYVSTHEDITERKAAEERVRHVATHDALTNKPNRFLFQDRLHQVLKASRRTGQKGGILFIDLDRFKDVNDSLGHEVGDELLKEVAARLSATVRDADTAARFGGDEFAVLIPTVTQPEELARVAERLIESISRPLPLAGTTLQTGASIGITLFPDDGADAIELMRNADIALYEAKAAGRGQYRFFTQALNARVQERTALSSDLRGALAQNQFVVHYQPQVDLASGTIIGVEALLRWQHPQRGLISPVLFIPLAEQSGLISSIGEWVLRETCVQLRGWLDAGFHLRAAVNVSAAQIHRHDLVQVVKHAIADYNIPPESLELEITESTFLEDPTKAIKTFERLRDLGVHIALDDFGTGYSSLSYLRRLPLTNIKIDRSFINDIANRAIDASIVRNIIAMAHGLGPIRVTAEGVEEKVQYEKLLQMGCDHGQGYFFSRPATADKIGGLLSARFSVRLGRAVS